MWDQNSTVVEQVQLQLQQQQQDIGSIGTMNANHFDGSFISNSIGNNNGQIWGTGVDTGLLAPHWDTSSSCWQSQINTGNNNNNNQLSANTSAEWNSSMNFQLMPGLSMDPQRQSKQWPGSNSSGVINSGCSSHQNQQPMNARPPPFFSGQQLSNPNNSGSSLLFNNNNNNNAGGGSSMPFVRFKGACSNLTDSGFTTTTPNYLAVHQQQQQQQIFSGNSITGDGNVGGGGAAAGWGGTVVDQTTPWLDGSTNNCGMNADWSSVNDAGGNKYLAEQGVLNSNAASSGGNFAVRKMMPTAAGGGCSSLWQNERSTPAAVGTLWAGGNNSSSAGLNQPPTFGPAAASKWENLGNQFTSRVNPTFRNESPALIGSGRGNLMVSPMQQQQPIMPQSSYLTQQGNNNQPPSNVWTGNPQVLLDCAAHNISSGNGSISTFQQPPQRNKWADSCSTTGDYYGCNGSAGTSDFDQSSTATLNSSKGSLFFDTKRDGNNNHNHNNNHSQSNHNYGGADSSMFFRAGGDTAIDNSLIWRNPHPKKPVQPDKGTGVWGDPEHHSTVEIKRWKVTGDDVVDGRSSAALAAAAASSSSISFYNSVILATQPASSSEDSPPAAAAVPVTSSAAPVDHQSSTTPSEASNSAATGGGNDAPSESPVAKSNHENVDTSVDARNADQQQLPANTGQQEVKSLMNAADNAEQLDANRRWGPVVSSSSDGSPWSISGLQTESNATNSCAPGGGAPCSSLENTSSDSVFSPISTSVSNANDSALLINSFKNAASNLHLNLNVTRQSTNQNSTSNKKVEEVTEEYKVRLASLVNRGYLETGWLPKLYDNNGTVMLLNNMMQICAQLDDSVQRRQTLRGLPTQKLQCDRLTEDIGRLQSAVQTLKEQIFSSIEVRDKDGGNLTTWLNGGDEQGWSSSSNPQSDAGRDWAVVGSNKAKQQSFPFGSGNGGLLNVSDTLSSLSLNDQMLQKNRLMNGHHVDPNQTLGARPPQDVASNQWQQNSLFSGFENKIFDPAIGGNYAGGQGTLGRAVNRPPSCGPTGRPMQQQKMSPWLLLSKLNKNISESNLKIFLNGFGRLHAFFYWPMNGSCLFQFAEFPGMEKFQEMQENLLRQGVVIMFKKQSEAESILVEVSAATRYGPAAANYRTARSFGLASHYQQQQQQGTGSSFFDNLPPTATSNQMLSSASSSSSASQWAPTNSLAPRNNQNLTAASRFMPPPPQQQVPPPHDFFSYPPPAAGDFFQPINVARGF